MIADIDSKITSADLVGKHFGLFKGSESGSSKKTSEKSPGLRKRKKDLRKQNLKLNRF